MKVLHFPYNIASQIEITVRALRDLGVEARGLVSNRSQIHSSTGLEDVSRVGSPAGALTPRWFRDRLGGTAHVLGALQWADVVHCHYGGAAVLPGLRDLKWATWLNRPRFVTFWGSDIRVPEVEAGANPYYARVCAQPGAYWQRESKERSHRTQRFYAERGFHCVLGSESMIPHLLEGAFPRYHLMRCSIRLDQIHAEYPDRDRPRPRIIHSPSDVNSKGSSAVFAAVEALERKGLNFDFVLVKNMPRERALEVLRSADIFLDQFVLGAYGMAAIEAMAFGKPVVCYIRAGIPYPTDSPIVNATQDDLAEVLEPLIVSADRRHNLGVLSRAYVEKYHDALVVTKDLLRLYVESTT